MLQGEDVTDNYKVVAKDGANIVETISFDYAKGMEKAELELRMAVLHKGSKVPFVSPYKVADGTNTTYMLASKQGVLAYAPNAYQAIIPEQGEAQILYLINSSTVRPSQLRTDQIKAFEDFLTEIKSDERRTIKGTEIIAYASPDGKEDFNEKLSTKRATTAEAAFNKQIEKKVELGAPVESISISEDWDGFKELVQNSDLEDKHLIVRVLEMYSDPMVREREIKNMSQVYTILADEILPQLRRARFITHIEFKNYTDSELLDLVDSNIETLDREALLKVATLIEDDNKKVRVYQRAIDKFNCSRAGINLAVTYLNLNKMAEAQAALNGVDNKSDYYHNTLGVLELRKGNISAASAAFAKSNIKETAYNLGTIDILNGNYSSAYSKLSGANNANAALAAILVNKLPEAKRLLTGNDPLQSYLKAIVAARQGDVSLAKREFASASKDTDLAERAKTDIEFAKLK